MAAEFEHIESGVYTTLPGVSVSGNNPALNWSQKAGDIVHQRNGQTISARTWASVNTWNLVMPAVTTSELTQIRAYWDDRVFYIRPTGSAGFRFTVRWVGDFNPQYISPGLYSLEIPLEETL